MLFHLQTPQNSWPRHLTTLLLVMALLMMAVHSASAQEPDPAAEEEPTTIGDVPSEAADSPTINELLLDEAADEDVAQAPAATPQVDDESIRERLESIFSFVQGLDQVDVEVQSGVVRLTGSASTVAERTRAEELARTTPGVVYVDNQIEEVVDVGVRISPTMERLQGFFIDFVRRLPLLLLALLIVIIFWQGSRLLVIWQWPFKKMTTNVLARELIKQGVRVVVVVAGLLIALDLLDATTIVGAVLGTAGVFGIALGFAFRDIAENYLASIILSARRPFEANDLVEIENLTGKVVRLTMRETILMTIEGNHVRIPNATVFKSNITNFTRNPRQRFDFNIGVGNDEDLTQTMALGLAILKEMKGILDEPRPLGRITELADSSVTLCFAGWVNQQEADIIKVKSEAMRRIKEAFDEAGIAMPSPIYVVEMTEHVTRHEPETESVPADSTAKRAADIEDEVTDIGVDDDLQHQIDDDRRRDEDNLLDDDGSSRP